MSIMTSFMGYLDIFVLSAVILIGLLYKFTKKDIRVAKYLDKIDGLRSFPIIGSILSILVPNHELIPLLLSLSRKYGHIFKGYIANLPYVVICGAEEIETLLSSSHHIQKSNDYSFLDAWLGQGLLTARPQRWHTRRKLLTPTFHFSILEQFIVVFNEQAAVLIDQLQKCCSNSENFDIFPHITRCTLDIICETAMGKKLNAQSGKELEYVEAVYRMGWMVVQKFIRPWLRIGIIWKLTGFQAQEKKYLKILHDFTKKVILDKKEERALNNVIIAETTSTNPANSKLRCERKAFLDLLLDLAQDGSLSDLDIREETDTFMFEGHDTTAANLVWTIFMLGTYPEHQKRVQDELQEIFGNDNSRDITGSDISKMKYLECCIKETLRLYPSVPVFFRNIEQDIQLRSGVIIPKDVSVVIAPICLHRDPDLFHDPETFNPERFFPENCVGRHPYAYIPFSAGPRNCIGQKFALLEEKVILAKLLMNFNVQALSKREDVIMVPDIILRPMHGIHVKLTAR